VNGWCSGRGRNVARNARTRRVATTRHSRERSSMCANRMSTLACGYPISDLDQDDHMKQPCRCLSRSVRCVCRTSTSIPEASTRPACNPRMLPAGVGVPSAELGPNTTDPCASVCVFFCQLELGEGAAGRRRSSARRRAVFLAPHCTHMGPAWCVAAVFE
jgi:hypothetical protein